MTRRALLGSAAAAVFVRPASVAEFEFKLGVNTPETHPLTIRLTDAAHAIAEQSSGRLNVTVFANSQPGGDPEMLSQLRELLERNFNAAADQERADLLALERSLRADLTSKAWCSTSSMLRNPRCAGRSRLLRPVAEDL